MTKQLLSDGNIFPIPKIDCPGGTVGGTQELADLISSKDVAPTKNHICCPQCRGVKVVRYGKAVSGRQKYKCRNCERQFVLDPGNRRIDDKTKRVVLQLLSEGVPPAKIKNSIPDVSLRWIYTLKKRLNQA